MNINARYGFVIMVSPYLLYKDGLGGLAIDVYQPFLHTLKAITRAPLRPLIIVANVSRQPVTPEGLKAVPSRALRDSTTTVPSYRAS